MKTKLVEIRDKGTTIIALAVRPGIDPIQMLPAEVLLGGDEHARETVKAGMIEQIEHERWLWGRAGYGRDYDAQRQYLLLYPVDPSAVSYFEGKPYDTDHNDRTITTAHRWLEQHFDEIESGAVVDVEFIRGETEAAKISDRWATV